MMIIPCIIWALLFGLTTCDIEKDKERCANQLVGAATCLPYVTGDANVPPMDCCSGFNQIAVKTPECVCLLVKDKDDPSLGLKINITRALGLPARCHAPVNLTVGDCPALLHLPPNSADAKFFHDLANVGNTTSAPVTGRRPGTTSTTTTTNTNQGSDGGKRKSYLGSEMLLLVAMVIFCI